MGFFSKLFGVKPPTTIPKFEISASLSSYDVEIQQKTRDALEAAPISAWDGYVSPSGGYVNYGRYQVVGRNTATNRKSKRTYEARDKEDACKCAENAGLAGPFEINVLPALPPTDAQISYAKSLGAAIPEGACSVDVSAIISRITDDDESPAPENLVRTAHECGIKFSRYHGRKAIRNLARNISTEVYIKIIQAT